MLWQGNMVSGSLLQPDSLLIALPGQITIVEVMAVLLAFTVLIERSLLGDYRLRRSYLNAPMVMIAVVFFASWARGSFMLQRYVPVLEAHEAFALPFWFFLVSNAFRDPEEGELLLRMIILAAIAKGFDGISVYFFSHDPTKSWGVIQLWRDAYLAAVGVACAFAFFHYRGVKYRRLRQLVLLSSPLVLSVMILGVRRSAMISTVGAAFLMFLYLPREHRVRHLAVFAVFLIGFIVIALTTDPLNIFARLSGIVSPKGEGSAYIRVLEYPNVLENIRQHPILGVPPGIPWKTYFRMPISADYTTLGTHNAYLYWPLRAGIFGAIAYFWLIGRAWKCSLVAYRIRRTPEEFVIGLCIILMLTIYGIASMFGLLYADYMSTFMGVVFTLIQLHARKVIGRSSLNEVSFWQTMRRGTLVFNRGKMLSTVPHTP
jgi:hypothetical protein